MRVLVVDAFPPDHQDAHVVRQTVEVLESHGNEVAMLRLAEPQFDGFMTASEREAYETDAPLQTEASHASAAAVQAADALLFCYPTTLFGVPPRLKSWLERVMVVGVAFVFDDKQRIRAGMKNIRRLGVVTTTSHSRVKTIRARDLGYRTFMRTLRLNCHPRCRRTFVRLATGAPAGRVTDQLNRSLRAWAA